MTPEELARRIRWEFAPLQIAEALLGMREALGNCASKLDSQVSRNPSLPTGYRTILAEAWAAIARADALLGPLDGGAR